MGACNVGFTSVLLLSLLGAAGVHCCRLDISKCSRLSVGLHRFCIGVTGAHVGSTLTSIASCWSSPLPNAFALQMGQTTAAPMSLGKDGMAFKTQNALNRWGGGLSGGHSSI